MDRVPQEPRREERVQQHSLGHREMAEIARAELLPGPLERQEMAEQVPRVEQAVRAELAVWREAQGVPRWPVTLQPIALTN